MRRGYVIFATSPSLLSETKIENNPSESGCQSAWSHVPRCGIQSKSIAQEFETVKSHARGLSTSVETLSVRVLGENKILPAKYPDVINCPNGPQSNTCVRAFQVLVRISSEVITGNICTSQTFSRADFVVFTPFSQRVPRINTRPG